MSFAAFAASTSAAVGVLAAAAAPALAPAPAPAPPPAPTLSLVAVGGATDGDSLLPLLALLLLSLAATVGAVSASDARPALLLPLSQAESVSGAERFLELVEVVAMVVKNWLGCVNGQLWLVTFAAFLRFA